jgi:hypothetical protein
MARADRSHFNELFYPALMEGAHGRFNERNRPMDVSSVSPSSPVAPVDTSGSQPQVQATTSTDNNSDYQPPPKAPLPPGQGTRVDQLA